MFLSIEVSFSLVEVLFNSHRAGVSTWPDPGCAVLSAMQALGAEDVVLPGKAAHHKDQFCSKITDTALRLL